MVESDGPFFAVRVRGPVGDVEIVVAAVREAAERFGVFAQAADEAWVYDSVHAESAWLHAVRAMREGRAGSSSPGGEFLRYLTGERQAGRAIEAGGVKPGAEAFVLVAAGPKAGAAVWRILDVLGLSRDPVGVGPNETALERLGITAEERRTVEADRHGELALERVALMDLERR